MPCFETPGFQTAIFQTVITVTPGPSPCSDPLDANPTNSFLAAGYSPQQL